MSLTHSISSDRPSPARTAVEVGVAIVGMAAIGWLDYITGPEISFAPIYLVPIVIAAWWYSRTCAWTAVAAASVVWFAADLAWYDPSHLWIVLWNGTSRLVIFSGAVWAITRVREARDRERVEAIEALRSSEARFRGLVESTSDWMWETDADQHYTYCSPTSLALLGWRPDELIGRRLTALMPAAEEARVRQAFLETLDRRDPLVRVENINLHKDGREVVLETSAVPVFDAAGEFRGYRGIDRDVTERKRVEQERVRLTDQLNQAQRVEAIGRLAGGVAHDFNNLLTVILGSAEFLLESLGDTHPGRMDAEEIHKAGDRARRLTAQLLAFGRRQVLAPRPIDLNAVVSGMDGLLQRLVREDLLFHITLAPAVVATHADPSQIEQVITNLVANARDAMPDGGTLTIATGFACFGHDEAPPVAAMPPGTYVTLTVQDTGVGMDAASLARIFEPFFTTKGRTEGTGLGLATVRGIVEQSGGHVHVASAVSRGSTFTIYLPRIEDAVASSTARASTEIPRGDETILIAEDEFTVRTLLARFLEGLGYVVIVSATPEDALTTASRSSTHIDLLLTDVVMPGMNGPVLASHVAVVRPGIKVLYVSGYPDAAVAHHGVFEPGAALLSKPFTREALARKIREILD
jgi:PAS domain S-box-containing protein